MIDMYISWSHHQPFENMDFDWETYNITAFIELAASLDFYLLVRPGPYITNEGKKS